MSLTPVYSGRAGQVDPVLLRGAISAGLDITNMATHESIWQYELRHTMNGTTEALQITDEDLARVHPKLVAMVHHLARQSFVAHPTDLLDSTLDQMEDSHPSMFDVSLKPYKRAMVQVDSFYAFDVMDNEVNIQLSFFMILDKDIPNVDMYARLPRSVKRSFAFMDKHYPQWRERLKLAQGLDLASEATANHVMNFKRELLPEVSVPNENLPLF